jgi:hypothetical protein
MDPRHDLYSWSKQRREEVHCHGRLGAYRARFLPSSFAHR